MIALPRVLVAASLLILLLVSSARADDREAAEAAAKAKALVKGRARLEKSLAKSVATVGETVAGGVLALLRTKPQAEADQASPVSGLLDALLRRTLLRGGICVRDVEVDGVIPAVYKQGKLSPKSRVASTQRDRVRDSLGSGYSLEVRWAVKRDRYTVSLRLRELVKGRTRAKWSLSTIDAHKVSLQELIVVQPLPAANEAILLYAIRMLGKRVDRGECWDIPAVPLKARGFIPEGYDFGARVSFKDALPGDVVTIDAYGHHHVMVLWRKRGSLGASSILHQNWDGKRHVMLMRYPGKMIKGSIIWRPRT